MKNQGIVKGQFWRTINKEKYGNYFTNAFKGIERNALRAAAKAIIDSKLIYKDNIDYLIVFPWNLISEIKNNNNNLAKNGTKFVKIIPDIEILWMILVKKLKIE